MSRALGFVTGAAISHASSPPWENGSSRMLQLMKTTCGMMHGTISFRNADTATWTSGYCTVHLTSGSLIFWANEDPLSSKTLIPDLRGCQVYSLVDLDSQTNYLNVSTFTSALWVELRPSVSGTLESWFAAFLCWQHIRPKGVRNMMIRLHSVAAGNRGQTSECTVLQEAAIIKVGNMLLWDAPNVSGGPSAFGQLFSAYQELPDLLSSWQRVKCTLQGNGVFRLFGESDMTPMALIRLSHLSRSAVQNINEFTLRDKFCIAVYPYFAAPAVPRSQCPTYVALESYDLFEVWFVLLRAFTVAELYGPETTFQDNQNNSLVSRGSSTEPVDDTFRIARTLSIKVMKVKLFKSQVANGSLQSRQKSRSHRSPASASAVSDSYVEILLDGELRAKTPIKFCSANLWWREEFVFNDLPPFLSQVSILAHTLNLQNDRRLNSNGSCGLNQNKNPLHSFNDVQSSDEIACGKVDLELKSLESDVEFEKWAPILDGRGLPIGEMFWGARLDETVVLMAHEYRPMSELLHSFSNGITTKMAKFASSEPNQLLNAFLDIYQASGTTLEWISALVEDEIDGVRKSSTAQRLIYAKRIHSHNPRDAAQNREVLLRDLGRSATVEANLLFRGTSTLTRVLDFHMRRLGKKYLEETVGGHLREIGESDLECEVDTSRMNRPDDLERNWKILITLTANVWKSIFGSSSRCPAELRLIFRHIRACAEDGYGDFLQSIRYSSVSAFLFLRFFCPAILNPKQFGLLNDHPRPHARRTLTLIAKGLQGLANMRIFGSKEPWMVPMNRFLAAHHSEVKQFVDSVCAIPVDQPNSIVPPSYAAPLQILSRLPTASCEGIPSLPFLIDSGLSFANLVRVWLRVAPESLVEVNDLDPSVKKFHEMALRLRQRTDECLSKAEKAAQPIRCFEATSKSLVDSMENSARLYDKAPSIP